MCQITILEKHKGGTGKVRLFFFETILNSSKVTLVPTLPPVSPPPSKTTHLSVTREGRWTRREKLKERESLIDKRNPTKRGNLLSQRRFPMTTLPQEFQTVGFSTVYPFPPHEVTLQDKRRHNKFPMTLGRLTRHLFTEVTSLPMYKGQGLVITNELLSYPLVRFIQPR